MKGKTITATKTSPIIYIVAALMLSTAVIYFVVASQSYLELSQLTSQSSINKDALSEIMGITNELIFFTIVGIAYITVGFWILKCRYHSKIPYIVAIAGSAALIVFYIATRTVSLPTIGLQTDIGILDTVSKLLQGAIIVGSLFVLRLCNINIQIHLVVNRLILRLEKLEYTFHLEEKFSSSLRVL